eukprot:3729814-Amphidinium_carterae.1
MGYAEIRYKNTQIAIETASLNAAVIDRHMLLSQPALGSLAATSCCRRSCANSRNISRQSFIPVA